MADHDQEQKTEQPTEKKLSEAIDRGQFAKSHELTVLFPIAAVLGVLTLTAPAASREIAEYSIGMFTRFAVTSVEQDTVLTQISEAMLTFGRAIGPLFVGIVVAVLIASGVQSGFHLSPKAVGFKLENLNPIAGFGRIFSKSVLVRSGIDLLKLVAIGSALWLGARGLMLDPLFSAPVEAAYLGQFLNNATIVFLTRLLFALGIVAAISFGYEKFKMSRELMMTRDEVKDERKQAEGDMHTKAAMRRMARRLLQKQMLAAVQTADVVVTNPTHFAIMPGMPMLPFFGLAGMAAFLGKILREQEMKNALLPPEVVAGAKPAAGKAGKPGEPATGAAEPKPGSTAEVRKLIEVDVFAIEVGYGLLGLADPKTGGELLARVTGVRKSLAREKGIVVPPVSVRDNLELEPNDYRFLLRGKPVARGQLMPGRWLAMNVSGSKVKLKGVPTREPVFNLDATWIDEAEKKTAELNGFTVVDPASVLITHLSETLKGNAHHLLGRQEVQAIVDHLKQTQPALIGELLPDLVTLGIIQRVFQNLLRENVAILNQPLILEGIADFASLSKNPDDLSELVRRRLGLYFVPEYECRAGVVRAVTLDPRLEQWLAAKVHRTPTEVGLALDPATGRHLMEQITRYTNEMVQAGQPSVLVVSAEIRLPLKRFFESSFPRLTVLSFQELPSATEIENAGIITAPVHVARAEVPLKAAA